MVSLNQDEIYIKRCFELAKQAGKATKTNPMVGAVLVHQGNIIGEGYHEYYGGPHAEVNAINSVDESNRHLIRASILYVSLEPCCFSGKTPACTSLIVDQQIKDVRISAQDPFPEVNGKGIGLLEQHGIRVTQGILEAEGNRLIKKFVTNNIDKRPYVMLKIVESRDGYIGIEDEQVWLSNDASKMLSHKWRSEVDGIMVGTNTAVIDNPSLTTRLYPGDNPIRIVFDHHERIPKSHQLLADPHETIVLSRSKTYELPEDGTKTLIQLEESSDLAQILEQLFQRGINSLIVEGGAQLIKSFVSAGLWDECRLIRCPIKLEAGIKSPLVVMKYHEKYDLDGDLIVIGHPSKL